MAIALLAAVTTVRLEQTGGWVPRLIICNQSGCHEAPDPYWEGPFRVQRPCPEWRYCYWRQKWW